jgi:uncharacterized protein YgbK (DUF1537 family)
MQLAILADDLTGAADAGGTFASAGFSTVIALGESRVEDVDVLVLSTDSRELDAASAADANRRAARSLLPKTPLPPPRWVYKKIDSALRGHPCAELLAVMTEMGETRALVAPALPVQGRTTVRSQQLINGVPLQRTSFESASYGSNLLSMFGCGQDVPVHALDLATVRSGVERIAECISEIDAGILVVDAETDGDLAAIARGALRANIRLLAGSAGLTRQLASALPQRASLPPSIMPVRDAVPTLVVAASRHDSTTAQVAVLQEAGIPIVRPSQEALEGVDPFAGSAVSELTSYLTARRSVVFTTAGLPPSRLGPAFVAEHIAEVVAILAKRHLIGSMILTGGDVAANVMSKLEASEVVLGGEVQPAVPWGLLRSRLLSEVPVVTKAGSFGAAETLLECLSFLEERDR